MDITYFENEYLPGVQHFECERLKASLSVAACSGNWRRANHERDLARHGCKGCKFGALHAGASGASCSPFRGLRICGRCHSVASRLIGKHLCISCYNRQREFLVGKNAKGTRPVKLTALYARSVTYQRADGTVLTRTIDRTIDTTEVVVAILRDEQQAVRFGFRGRGPAFDDAELEPSGRELDGEAAF